MATHPQPPSFDEHLAELESHPLFMSTLPDDPSNNPVLGALQDLVHDGTPDGVAQNFKEQGNEYFRGKRYREALGFYTQGVDAKPDDVQLKEALLLNRAACNLELENYGSVLRDCAAVIKANAHASKAYYRAGLALLALERVDEVFDVCARAGEGGPDDAKFKTLRERAEKKRDELRRKEEEKGERTQRAREEERRLAVALAERNLISVPDPDGSALPFASRFDPDDPTGHALFLPVFFLYPEHAMSDVVAEYLEDTPFGAHLAMMFPQGGPFQPWDTGRKYVDDGSLVIYTTTRRKRLLKVGRKMTLRQLCRAAGTGGGSAIGPDGKCDGLELIDGCLSFVVVLKGEVEQKWVEEFKRTKVLRAMPVVS